MPSDEIMPRFEKGKLHSGKKVKGKKRKIVKNPQQAKAILLSTLRKEGRIGPRKDGNKKKTVRKRVAGKK
jgi:hypothetical protein